MKKQCVLLGLFGLFSMLYGQAEGECISGATRLDKSELYPDQMIIWGCSKGEWVALSDEDNARSSMLGARIMRLGDEFEQVHQKLASDKEVGATYIALDRHLVSKSGTDTYTILRNWSHLDSRSARLDVNSPELWKVVYDEISGDFYIYDYLSITFEGLQVPPLGWRRLNNYIRYELPKKFNFTLTPCDYSYIYGTGVKLSCFDNKKCEKGGRKEIEWVVVGNGRTRALAKKDAEDNVESGRKTANYIAWLREYEHEHTANQCQVWALQSQQGLRVKVGEKQGFVFTIGREVYLDELKKHLYKKYPNAELGILNDGNNYVDRADRGKVKDEEYDYLYVGPYEGERYTWLDTIRALQLYIIWD